jgi:hypothetical protein
MKFHGLRRVLLLPHHRNSKFYVSLHNKFTREMRLYYSNIFKYSCTGLINLSSCSVDRQLEGTTKLVASNGALVVFIGNAEFITCWAGTCDTHIQHRLLCK